MPRWRLSWVALLVAAVCGPVSTQAQETQPGTLRGKRILVLNSYMRGTPYTELQEAGIRQALESHPSGPTWVRYEYLDGYPKSDAAALRFAEILEERYSNPPIDVVLTTDSPALMFAAEHRDWLFPGRPIVFSAPSSIPPDLRKRTPNVTGIVEEIDAVRTIRLMRRLFPDRPKIVGIISESDYGVMLRDSIQIALAKETPPIVVEWWLDRDPRGLRQKAAELPPDHVVLFCNAGVMSIV